MGNRLPGEKITHIFCSLFFVFCFLFLSLSGGTVRAQTYCSCGPGTPNSPKMLCGGSPGACFWATYCGGTSPSGVTYTTSRPNGNCTDYYVCTPEVQPHKCNEYGDDPLEELCYADGLLICGPGLGSPAPPGTNPTAPPGASPTPTFTPTPTPILASIRVRGVLTPTYHTLSCPDIRSLATGINGAQFRIDGVMWHSDVGTQTGSTYVDFLNQAREGMQTVRYEGAALSSYVIDRACWVNSAGGDGTGLVASLNTGETLTWDISFTTGVPFFQTEGGNVYSGGTMTSLLPLTVSPRVFARTPIGSTPGIVNVGSVSPFPGYDFAIGGGNDYGKTLVSETNQLVSSPVPTRQLYPLYSHRVLAGSNPKHVYDPVAGLNAKPPIVEGENPTIYTYNLDDTTPAPLILGDIVHTPWVIGAGEKIILIANSDVTIRAPITITGNGFFALIAKGTVSIDPTVGGTWNSTVPVLEGVYIAGTAFKTGDSTVAGRERLVTRGSVLSDTMTFERDLSNIGGVNHNADTSAVLFTHSPRLVLSTPDILNDRRYLWQEVNP